jgi:hypothetical protein
LGADGVRMLLENNVLTRFQVNPKVVVSPNVPPKPTRFVRALSTINLNQQRINLLLSTNHTLERVGQKAPARWWGSVRTYTFHSIDRNNRIAQRRSAPRRRNNTVTHSLAFHKLPRCTSAQRCLHPAPPAAPAIRVNKLTTYAKTWGTMGTHSAIERNANTNAGSTCSLYGGNEQIDWRERGNTERARASSVLKDRRFDDHAVRRFAARHAR